MLDVKLKLRPGHTEERRWMAPSELMKLCWNSTYGCNYRCGICFADAGKAQDDELSTREAEQMLTEAAEAGVRDVIVSGGEPFHREDMPALLVRMARLGMSARIASNGSLLTPDLLQRLRDETLTKSFQISIDTLDRGLYLKIHGCPAGTLDGVLRTVQAIKARGFHTTISVRVTPATLAGIPDLLDLAAREGWETVTLHLPVHTRRSGGAFSKDEDMLTRLEPLFESFLDKKPWVVETYIPWAEHHPVMKRLEERIRVVHCGCRAGRDRLTVNPQGWVSPCVCLDVPAAYLGNVRQDRLERLFRESPLCRMLRAPRDHGICADCPRVAVCGGGCRAAAYALTGRMDGQDESCPVRVGGDLECAADAGT